MVPAASFYRNIGLAGGSLWLVVVGIAYVTWALITVQSGVATFLMATMVAAACALIYFGLKLILSLRCLTHEPGDRSERRRLGIRFGLIVAAEAAGCVLVVRLCLRAHRWELIVPLILVVVGLHFLPLAQLFHVPRYYLTGALFCAISLVTLMVASPSAHIGHAFVWVAIPTIGCGLVSLATGAAGLDEVRRFLKNSGAVKQSA